MNAYLGRPRVYQLGERRIEYTGWGVLVAVLLILALILFIIGGGNLQRGVIRVGSMLSGQSTGTVSQTLGWTYVPLGDPNEVVTTGNVLAAQTSDGYSGQGGTLGDISRFLTFGEANSSSIEWFDWDEQNSHEWSDQPGLYAPQARYSDTGIPLPNKNQGTRTYNLRDTLAEGIIEYPEGLFVIVTGAHVTGDLGNGQKFVKDSFIGSYQARAAMVFTITDGSIKFVDQVYAQGETCAMTELSVLDYGPKSIRFIDVPQTWTCPDDQLAAGLFKDPTRHGLPPGTNSTTNTNVSTNTGAQGSNAPVTVKQGDTVVATSGGVRIRAGAGTGFANLGNLTSAVVIKQITNGWANYDCPQGVTSQTGCWTSASLLKVGSTPPTGNTGGSVTASGRHDLSNTPGKDLNGDGKAEELEFPVGQPVFGAVIVINGKSYQNCAFASAPAAGYVVAGVWGDSKAQHGLSACQ